MTVSAGSGQVPAALVRTPASWQARSSVEPPGEKVFYSHVHLHGGPTPVRRFLPELIGLICNRTIHPGNVFDLELPLEQAAEGYRATDERRAINALLRLDQPPNYRRSTHGTEARQSTVKTPASNFTGDVYLTPIYSGTEPSRMTVGLVRFTPGARTNWHR